MVAIYIASPYKAESYYTAIPVKPSCKNYSNLASIFLARLAISCAKSCKSCTKHEVFLARYKKSCKNLARNNCKVVFLQDLIKILKENDLPNFYMLKHHLMSLLSSVSLTSFTIYLSMQRNDCQ